MLLETLQWLRTRTEPGLSQLLARLGISYKRGRDYIHSPDPDYAAKLAAITTAREQARSAPEQFILIYLDELTYYRQPTLACAYEALGPLQPLAYRSYRANTAARIIAALDDVSGQVVYHQCSHSDVATLARFWFTLRQSYPHAERIDVVVDNWPVHYHPDVLAPLISQHFAWPIPRPANWPTQPSPKAKLADLPIRLLPLPTYASWLNPIEKLWRWLKQDILHLHRQSDDWPALKQRIAAFLDHFAHGSPELLRYAGLLPC